VKVEILPPGAPVPAAVAAPKVVAMWRDEEQMMGCVQFADGGVWGIADRQLANLSRSVSHSMDVGELFAQRAQDFYFIRRGRVQSWAAHHG
jgi:uncharacterized protein YaeQ